MATTVELLLTLLQAGGDKIIGDAGGGTIDMSAGANQEIFKQLLLRNVRRSHSSFPIGPHCGQAISLVPSLSAFTRGSS